MELICEKYREKMIADTARCYHPDEYCKFRMACMIHFMAWDKKKTFSSKKKDNQEQGND